MEKSNNKHDAHSITGKTKMWIAVFALVILYTLISLFFTYHYYPGTVINGFAGGFRSVGDVKQTIRDSLDAYRITVKERQNRLESVTARQISLTFTDDGKLEQIKRRQKGYAWPLCMFQDRRFDKDKGIAVTMDQKALRETVNQMEAFRPDLTLAPADAWSKYDKSSNSYIIVDEVYGNTIKKKTFVNKLKEAILGLEADFDVEAEGCYKDPVYKKDSAEITESNQALNRYIGAEITYDFDDRTRKLTGKKFNKWLYVTDKFEVKIHREMAQDYIKGLADKFDTVGVKRNFTSIAGNKISVEGGTYGWKIDQAAEVKKLIKLIKKGKKVTREPEYAHIAKSRKKQDLGDTYVEVDLSSQHMWFYKNGKILVSTPVVTGDTSRGRGTPSGVYYILYKTTDYTLTGQGYASHVDYWLPFTHQGVGIHDSSWRSSYGGGIFSGNGSHGCVNTPRAAVRTIYNNIESTYPVAVHW